MQNSFFFILSFVRLEGNIWSAEKKGNGEGRGRKYLEKNDILICGGERERKYQLASCNLQLLNEKTRVSTNQSLKS